MTNLAISLQTTAASFAVGDEWDGISALTPEATEQSGGYQVAKTFAKVGVQGSVGLNAEAMVMAAGIVGGTSKLFTWETASYPQTNAAMLGASRSAIQRKRLAPGQILLAVASDRSDAAPTWDLMSLRSAGFPAPLCLPRAVACAAAMPIGDAPLAVIEIGFDDVLVSEVRYDGAAFDCTTVTRKKSLGVAAIWRPLYKQLEERFSASLPNIDLARCEAMQFARLLIAHALNSRGAIAALSRLRQDGDLMRLDSVIACGVKTQIDRWCKEVADAIVPALSTYRQAVVTVEDCGIAPLSAAVTAQMQRHVACEFTQGIDAALGAARIAASGTQLEPLSQRYAQVSKFREMSFGVLRPDGSGGTSYHALGEVTQLTAPQKFSLRTTREDQARIVLPLGLCAPNATPQMLGILEFPLSAPAKKGVLVEFYIELADPLIHVRGVEEQSVAPVGEIFVPLDPALANEAAEYREFVSSMGAVY